MSSTEATNGISRRAVLAGAKTITDAPALPGWKVAPFPLRNVAITSNSVFDRAKEGMLDYARNYPVDRWLVCFRAQANLLPKDNTTQPSGGWENFPSGSLDKAVEQQWGDAEYTRGQNKNGADGLLRGHFAGHALHMLSQAYAETGEEAILNKINEFVSGLKECRDSLREMKYNGKARYSHPGFLAAYGEWQFKALEEYAPYGEIWAPWYTEHKILAGLIAAYEFAGNADALDLAEGIGHWTYARLSKCTKTQLQKMWDIYIGGEYGGMNRWWICTTSPRTRTVANFLRPPHFSTLTSSLTTVVLVSISSTTCTPTSTFHSSSVTPKTRPWATRISMLMLVRVISRPLRGTGA